MTELSTQDHGKRRNDAAHAAVLVSGYELARHFGCSRQNVELLATQGVIERRSDGKFDQDVCRSKYLTHPRSERARSPRAADAKHAEAKTALLQIRIEEKQRTLVRRDAHEAMIDQMAGLVLTKLGGWPAAPTLSCDAGLKPCCASCAPRLPKPAPSWRTNRVSRRSTSRTDE